MKFWCKVLEINTKGGDRVCSLLLILNDLALQPIIRTVQINKDFLYRMMLKSQTLVPHKKSKWQSMWDFKVGFLE